MNSGSTLPRNRGRGELVLHFRSRLVASAFPNMSQTPESRQKVREICRVAARVFYEKGYDGASVQEIAGAVGLTKPGLYHYFQSKDHLLFEIMNYGMDILQEEVLDKLKSVADPVEKLRRTIMGHIDLIVRARDREITVILHENRSLKGALRKKINARKRDYIHHLESLIAAVQEQKGSAPLIAPRVAAFALLGMINWLYQWYQRDGAIKQEEIEAQYADFFFRGLLGKDGC
jgi:AcrR family transcriptional regulator